MLLSELKNHLAQAEQLLFEVRGAAIPLHVHLTEVGVNRRSFIDCGGKVRHEERISMQLWFDSDTDHRLSADKFLRIVEMAEERLGLPDAPVEVEYQQETIGKFALEVRADGVFELMATQTACLAIDACVPAGVKAKVQLADLQASACAPGSGCCS
ncbi:MAG TPA: DUF6428 family protein [Luteibaculaceae bacterium]|nr:DUF6428 family protein [Luteibaculaceae bacterium]